MLYSQTRVLVTHGLAHLPHCDIIVTMGNGKITEVGAYAELMDKNGAFAEFVHNYTTMEDGDKEIETGNWLYLPNISFSRSLFVLIILTLSLKWQG